MRKAFIATLAVAALATSGCAALSGKQAAPDEFAVARNAPLIIPPDFNLAPPVAGTQGISAGEAQQQAIDTLFGGPAPRSAAETSLLDQAGRGAAPVGIPSTAWDPDTRIVDKGRTTLQILAAPPANTSIASAQVR
jgi:hypothetical protein